MTNPYPYCGPAPLPETLLRAWNLDPWLLAGLAAAGLGAMAVLRNRPARPEAEGTEPAAAAVAMVGLVIAFVSPLCALTVALFAARSLHHLLLLGVVAPALALAFPLGLRLGVPRLGVWFAGLSAALWAWHVPAVYAAAWDSAAIYWLMQAALLGSAWGFWGVVLHRDGSAHEAAGAFGGALIVAALAGQMGLIGAILTFSPQILYPQHLVTTAGFGLDALEDQKVAGLIMWVPGMAPLAALAALMLRRAWRGVQAA
jgi:putative membrane protein